MKCPTTLTRCVSHPHKMNFKSAFASFWMLLRNVHLLFEYVVHVSHENPAGSQSGAPATFNVCLLSATSHRIPSSSNLTRLDRASIVVHHHYNLQNIQFKKGQLDRPTDPTNDAEYRHKCSCTCLYANIIDHWNWCKPTWTWEHNVRTRTWTEFTYGIWKFRRFGVLKHSYFFHFVLMLLLWLLLMLYHVLRAVWPFRICRCWSIGLPFLFSSMHSERDE